jgi:septation ring formation regulator EzrA
MTKDEALKLALDAIEGVVYAEHNVQPAITAVKTVLAPSKFWTVLTDTQIHKINEDFEQDHGSLEHTRAIEAKLKELNQ